MSDPGSPPPPGPPLRARIAVTALSGAQLPVWLAQEAGLFTQNGLDVELSYIPTNQTAMGALLGNEVDALAGGPEAAAAVAVEGGDVVAVGAFLNRIVHAMYAAPSVRQPDDLRGRPVGVTRLAALSGSSARYLLRQWGLEADRDVTVVQTGGFPETLAALSSGAIQAGILPPPHTLRAQELGFVELGNLWTQPLEYPGGMITVRRPSGPEQEERARRMLRALVESIHRLREDRPLAIRVLQAETKIDDPRAVEESYDIYTPLFERDLRLSREAFRAALEELARTNPRAADANADSLMDPRFVDEIRQSGLVERLYAR